MDILEYYFGLLRQLNQYERRPSQERMVSETSRSLEEGKTLVVEAGTGSGKSFGYLIPLLFRSRAEGEKKPVVVSTATIALQEQLMEKDIPFLLQAAEMAQLNVRLVKGRGNYLCIQKMLDLERQLRPNAAETLHIQYLKAELDRGWSGDLADLDIALPPELWAEIRSDSDDCLGRRCRFYDRNPYRKAREDLDEADLLIANHALYLQDLGAAQSLLPEHDHVIFDEAHQLKQWMLSAFTIRIGKYATQKLLRKIHRRLQALPDAFHDLIADSEAALLEWLFRAETPVFRLYADDLFLDLVRRHIAVLREIEEWLASMDVRQLSVVRPDLIESDLDMDKAKVQREKLKQQLQGLTARWEYFLDADPFARHRVNWAETDRDRLYYELKSTPLNIAEIMSEQLWQRKTSVLTSATLAVNGRLNFVRNDLGIGAEARELVLPSPFQYERQCVLYLPGTMPEPNSPTFNEAVAEEVLAILRVSRGRAFVLFTSHGAMRWVSRVLIPQLPFPCKVQGELPRNRMLEWFKETPGSVIFATATFWEGIDIPGEALSCVIMDKIPFLPPDDPVNRAMVDYIKARGEDWFGGYVLPQAAIKLKQGFGRLIRTAKDKGLVAILDPRVRTKGYGAIIRRSLPGMTTIEHLDELPDWVFRQAAAQDVSSSPV